ncbi:Tetratricopeptide-like helical [Penicillium italicum]|uniref:Tetratricopeptide-like helical n=1 Tax=Penicillium italicum TaxID=40296 RepID=A0A0A2LQ11_PENIT|nr:Tetratricopeptide-like helical [Penicillium italicum]
MTSPAPGHRQALPSPPPAYLRSSPPFTPSQSPPGPAFSPPSLSPIITAIHPITITTDHPEPPQELDPQPQPIKVAYGADIPDASSARIEGAYSGPTTPQLDLPEFADMSLDSPVQPPQQSWNPADPPRRDLTQASHYTHSHPYGHTPASSGSWSVVEPQKDDGHGNPKKSGSSLEREGQGYGSSRGSLDSVPQASDSYEPLPYHHQQQPAAAPTKKPGPNAGDNPSASTDKLAVRRSRLSRPISTYSSASDGGPRRNLSASPYLHAQSSPRNSTGTPENRSSSFLDLLNTSYPQPGPTAQFDNSRLQASVGNYASLLSHKETFEMYLANVKKTDEPTVLYEFAVFMVNSMREMPTADLEDTSPITHARLLRESKSILQRLADRSYPFAQYYLGDGYASGLFSKGVEDHDRAFPLFIAASKHGHVEACYRTALCYEFGWGCRVDGGRAVQFYRQAASKNHPGAMMRMANACIAGDMGLGKRYREGVKWLKRATESADTQYNSGPYELGVLHERGFGEDVFPDATYAAQLFTKSAELGHVEACYRLGDAYEHGKLNCPRDPALSIHFYTNAAQNGHPLAMMALCAWYLIGVEPLLEKDENEAYEWALRAANLGLAKAEYAVGYFTEMGIGCRRDALEANVWYVKAADQGDERAKHRIATIRAAAEGSHPGVAGRNGGRLRKAERKDKSPSNDQEPELEKPAKQKRFVIF